jgi:hypothetical protein
MGEQIFDHFRLVGGTALSLYYGHRMSVDIDLFTDASYDTVDFDSIDTFLRNRYSYVSVFGTGPVGFGKSYLVGTNKNNAVKLDLFYHDSFIRSTVQQFNVRLAHPDDIAAMKIHVIQRGGRKKDFWDLHELMEHYTLKNLLKLHQEKYPYNHDVEIILKSLNNFEVADDDFEPICLRGKHWELIKLDICEWIESQ